VSAPTASSAARRLWAARVGSALAVWAVLTLGSHVLGGRPAPGLLALVVAAGGLMLWTVLDAVDRHRAPAWDREEPPPIRPAGEDVRLVGLDRVLAAHLDGRVVGDTLQRTLMALVDQQLMARHGVSWRVDPGRAGTLLGPELLGLARQCPPYPRMSEHEIDVLLTRIEEL